MKMEMLRNRLSYHGKSRHSSKQSRRLGAALGSADLITALLIKRLSCGQILASLWLRRFAIQTLAIARSESPSAGLSVCVCLGKSLVRDTYA